MGTSASPITSVAALRWESTARNVVYCFGAKAVCVRSDSRRLDRPPDWLDGTEFGGPDVRLHISNGAGPSHAYAAKTGVGFTGLHPLRYQGAGIGRITKKVFEVGIEVAPMTELSYVLFPEFASDAVSYASTFVAVDLAFTDGTYLSGLQACDQLGFELTPRGQGESKALYVGQWNRRACRIGEIAANKTISRILIGCDNPDGAAFSGWIDDIVIEARDAQPARRPSDYVVTTRGTHSSSDFSCGNTIPAAAVPNGFNFWTPVTNAGTTRWPYEYHRANNDQNRPQLQALALSHQPSPWMADRHTFQVMPWAGQGAPRADRAARALAFSHDDEVARPHYYRVTFGNGVRAEIAPTDHAAIFRFTFPDGSACLIFDNVDEHGGLVIDASNGSLTGYTDVGGENAAGASRMFVYATFDRAVSASRWLRTSQGRPSGFCRFESDGGPSVVVMRIATSLIGVAQAQRNLELEISPEDTLESVRDRAQRAWDDLLARVEVEGATEDQLVTLYSNLYRLFLYPNSGHENAGTADAPMYRHASPVLPALSADTATETGAQIVDGRLSVNNGFWDTYRTAWPAYALLAPALCGELIDGFLQLYREGGWVPRWSSPGYADCMTGTNSDVAFADAWQRGVRGFEIQTAFEAALRNATVTPPRADVGRKGLDRSIFRGFTDTATPEGLSWALEDCIDDFGIANLARALGDADHETYFEDRARNYRRHFDRRIGFFQGRAEDGSWRLSPDEFDPLVWGYDYTETDAWNFAFTAPHDGAGLAALYGGRQALGAKLDEYLATPETAQFKGSYRSVIHEMTEARDVRMGQYGHSNQPAHHILYMYLHAGMPWRTQQTVREVLARTYSGSEIGQGYCGDEDNGEMSAWWLLSALGLYPLAVGSPTWVIGSPLFTKAIVHLDNGKELVVNAPGNDRGHVYVGGLQVNGEPHESVWLSHDAIAGGAVLDFEMVAEPAACGSAAGSAPPSLTTTTSPPQTLIDVTGDPAIRVDTSAGSSGGSLFDDTTATAMTFPTSTGWVRWQLADPREVTWYTLTSGSDKGDPTGWTLQGSDDGRNWQIIDERADEVFRWRNQTRVFKVARPGQFDHYRLDLTTSTGEPTVMLAQLELLTWEAVTSDPRRAAPEIIVL
jgi:predicted alpha-1,2-mannosidase